MTKQTPSGTRQVIDDAVGATEIGTENAVADYDDLPFSKEKQLANSPGYNKLCSNTGKPRRLCSCYSCRGRRSRRKGQTSQRAVRKGFEKAFQTPAGPTVSSTSDEENWRLPVRVEAKSGVQAKTVGTFYRNTKAQADAKKSIGDSRPFVAAARIDGQTDPLVVLKMSDLIQLFEEARR